MRITTLIGTTLALTSAIGSLAPQLTQAVQLSDGTVYFTEPPSLVAATTTFKGVNMWGATYYFTINVPENAGEPLQRVTITQKQGTERIRYELKDSQAFEGTHNDKGPRLGLGEVNKENDPKVISVTFNPPVPPGKTVTIGLRPIHNPLFSGIYLFGVTAYPPGEKSHGQFLGYGRLQFYGNDRFGFP